MEERIVVADPVADPQGYRRELLERRARERRPGVLVVGGQRRPVLGQHRPRPEPVDQLRVPEVGEELGDRPLPRLGPAADQLVGKAAGALLDRVHGGRQHLAGVVVAQQRQQLPPVALRVRHRVGGDDPLLHPVLLLPTLDPGQPSGDARRRVRAPWR